MGGDLGEIFKLGIPWTNLVIRAVIIYIVFFIGLRLFGKRELGQFTTFDLVLVLLVANALQPAITGPDNVKQAVLENDGSISVVTKGSGERYRRRRRVRFLKR